MYVPLEPLVVVAIPDVTISLPAWNDGAPSTLGEYGVNKKLYKHRRAAAPSP